MSRLALRGGGGGGGDDDFRADDAVGDSVSPVARLTRDFADESPLIGLVEDKEGSWEVAATEDVAVVDDEGRMGDRGGLEEGEAEAKILA